SVRTPARRRPLLVRSLFGSGHAGHRPSDKALRHHPPQHDHFDGVAKQRVHSSPAYTNPEPHAYTNLEPHAYIKPEPHAYTKAEPDAYTKPHAYCDSNSGCNSDGNGNRNSYADSNGDPNSYAYGNGDSYLYSHAYTKPEPDVWTPEPHAYTLTPPRSATGSGVPL